MKRNLISISVLTMTGLFGLLVAFLVLLFWLADIPILYALIGGIICLILQFLISPWLTDLNMKWIYKAKFDTQIPDYLSEFISQVCQANNMKLPKIGYIDDGAPNAFTYGHTKNDARVILTRGIFELLNEEEVKAVVAHELGHAAHYDILVMTAAQLVPMVLYAIYQASMKYKSSSNNSDSSKGEGAAKLIGVMAYILYLISNYIVLWLSRTREYMADAFSADVTRNPNALASALVEIGFGLSTKEKKEKGQSVSNATTLGISDAPSSKAMAISGYVSSGSAFTKDSIKNAMKWDLWNPWATVYELNSTHPLISKRLTALSDLSSQYGQEPYVVFDLVKPESYMDDFAKDVVISFLPWITFIIGLVIFFAVNPGRNWMYAGLLLVVPMAASLYKYGYTHPKKEFVPNTVRSLLGEVKVSGVTSIPCEVNGKIIGRGNPGCIFNEDFVVQDETGIVFLDYEQPLFLINKIFALFKSPEYFDKAVTARGYYRRSPVPYIQLKELVIDGQTKKCYTISFGWIWRWIALGLAVIASIFFIFAGFAG